MQFIDRVKIKIKAGNGGDGITAFRREKYVPFGGPSGGDGGNGGSVIFEVDENRSTLLDLRFNKLIQAKSGDNGKTKKMHGAAGKDAIVRVPQGTLIKNPKTGAILADLTKHGQQVVIAKGGKGGRGNFHFKAANNTAPQYSEKGGLGQAMEIQLELKLLADIGLVGFPSVGKSTLLSVVSRAKPEIASYDFTTITPNLGMVQVPDGRSFVMADLPGLIEGASSGKGLGHQFLRHIERCRVILHVVDMGGVAGRDPVEDYRVINEELGNYEYKLLERPQIVVANKMDLDGAQENLERFKEAYPEIEVFPTTTIIDEGLVPVLYRAADLLAITPEFPLHGTDEAESEGVLYKFEEKKPEIFINQLSDDEWEVTGSDIERAFHMSKLDTDEDVMRFSRKMRTMNIDQMLRDAGCKDGDTVYICKLAFEFVE